MPNDNMIRAYIGVPENHVVEDDRLIMQLQVVANYAKQSPRQRLVAEAMLISFNESSAHIARSRSDIGGYAKDRING